MEINRGAPRIYGGAGYFSRGVWFVGGGAGARATPKTYVSVSYSRSWRSPAAADLGQPSGGRNDVTGSAAFELRSNISAFASLSRTIATADANGAGTSVSFGLSVFVPRAAK